MTHSTIKDYTFKKAAQKKIPVSGTLELTSRCNLNCRMCYIHMDSNEQCKYGKELSTEEWIAIANQAIEEGMIYCLLTGGEPLLRHDFEVIYKHLVKKGVLVTVNTNGILITSSLIQLFKDYRPEKINVSLYGSSNTTYTSVCGSDSFEKVKQNIRLLKDAGIQVNINTTFTKLNIMDLEEIVYFAKEEKIPIRMTSFIFPPVRNGHDKEDGIYLTQEEMGKYAAIFDKLTMTQEKIEKRKQFIEQCLEEVVEIEEVEKKLSCMAGRGSFWVSWNGEMYPCGMLDTYKASLKELNFKDAWINIVEQTKSIYLPKECSNCQYKKLCTSCAAVSLSLHGKSNTLPQDMCIRTKQYIQEFMK